jgi:hypothetical protein
VKRLTILAVLLAVAVLMASLIPVSASITVTNPADCPAGTIAVPINAESSSTVYECVPVSNPNPPTDPCAPSVEPCQPPTDPCSPQTTEPCQPPTDPCDGFNAEPCEPPAEHTTPHPANPQPTSRDTHDSVSFNDSDLGVSLFLSQDASGAPMLQVYETLNQETNGNFAMTVTQDDLAAFVNAPPAENTLLKSQGHVRIYVLTTGEISVLVGPDSEGKIHVKIFDGSPWNHVYGYTIDPQ